MCARVAVTGLLLLGVLLAACSGSDESEELTRLREQVADLRQELAAAPAAMAAETMIPSPTASATPPPTSTPTPAPESTAVAVSLPETVYTTGRYSNLRFVDIREACDARAKWLGMWYSGTAVQVEQRGVGECEGWSFVSLGDEAGWLQDAFLSESEPKLIDISPVVRYIANTDGAGVSVRYDCDDDARRGNDVWPEHTLVAVRQVGGAECTGWSLAATDERTSWVRDAYLEEERPAGWVPPPASMEPGQFEVVSASVTYNILGNPEARVTIKNISDATIDAFDVRICARNRYGESVKRYGIDSACITGTASARVAPGGSYTAVWTLYGQDTASAVTVSPSRSHTTGGDTWQR